ncbi:CaiB/BaiF CoA transferase family protein [Sphingomonas psychrotolerans]|uniref:Carnitine dehydratase n=1 Tax=Sphingomonas psychrotolerans TaxID=1327635 RepID=A0A2K8MHL0_9SPHN|nr:CaiB/BaiF CoA-transferase family protein [Sphingomonas psychrotolerans]ATY32474.1 carnitine dehydratase [Sphingomonas psychrotolerans]
MPGTLSGLRIVEFGGIGPAPFAAMMLADHGAEVIRIERPGASFGPHALTRSRKAIGIELKALEGIEIARTLCRDADGVIEGFRPGVMERLGLGPDVLLGDNPALVYGRMTGWGQDGPLAQAPGHDINYIAVAGLLDGIGQPGAPPTTPVNYLGDFGGGGMLLAFGMVSALLAVKMGAPGQVVDAAMTDGAALLASMSWGFKVAGMWHDGPGANLLSGAAPFYRTYTCADGKHVAVGAIEPQFYAALVAGLGEDAAGQMDAAAWPARAERFAAIFATRTRNAWTAHFAPEACVSPVLTFDEAAAHPHNAARGTFAAGAPAPAPHFAATPAPPPKTSQPGEWTDRVLAELGYDSPQIAALRAVGTIG